MNDCDTCAVPTPNASGVCDFCGDSDAPTLMIGNVVITEEVARPNWLFVSRFDDLDTGQAWRVVYRSIRLPLTHSWMLPVWNLVGDAESLQSEEVSDQTVMGYSGVLTVYAA